MVTDEHLYSATEYLEIITGNQYYPDEENGDFILNTLKSVNAEREENGLSPYKIEMHPLKDINSINNEKDYVLVELIETCGMDNRYVWLSVPKNAHCNVG